MLRDDTIRQSAIQDHSTFVSVAIESSKGDYDLYHEMTVGRHHPRRVIQHKSNHDIDGKRPLSPSAWVSMHCGAMREGQLGNNER